MTTVRHVKMRPRFSVHANGTDGNNASIYDRVASYRKIRRRHQEAYSVLDWVHTAEYLNARMSGYPVPDALLTLRSQHDEDRRQAPKPINTGRLRASIDRRRPARRKSRAAGK